MATLPSPEARRLRASFPNLARARHGMDVLQRAGLDAVNISLEGAPVTRAQGTADLRRVESRASGHIGRRILAGAFAGVLAGALMGLAGSIAMNAMGAGPLITTQTGVIVVVVAFVASMIGGIIAGIATVGLSRQWDETFGDDGTLGGEVVLEVASGDPRDLERARRALPRAGALRVVEE